VPLQADYKVKYGEAHCEPKFGARCMWGITGYVPTVFRNCSCNEKTSMVGRVGKALPVHLNGDLGVVEDRWDDVSRDIVPFLFKMVKRVEDPLPVEAWLSTFPPERREALRRVIKDGLELPPMVASSFIKRELVVKDVSDPIFKDPRFIQGCPIELTAATGRWLRKLAKRVRQSLRPKIFHSSELAAGRQIIYTCGLSSEAIGASFADSIELITSLCSDGEHLVFLEDDQSRFDMHLLSGPFGYLERLYYRWLPRRVARALCRETSRGRTNLGTKYSVPYTMQSGWPDTSVGDTLVNAAMKYTIHGVGRKWISIVCGDDSVTITTDRELARCGGLDGICAKYADLGMEVTAHTNVDPLLVEFCSGRFFPVGQGFVLMPKTGKLLAKLCWDPTDRSLPNQVAWLRGIAETLCHYGQLDPLLKSLGQRMKSLTGSGKVIRERENEFKHTIRGAVSAVATDAYTYYDVHYGMSASDVDSLVDVLSKVCVGSLCSDARLQAMVAKDM
jgi:hypothetical protein